MTANSTFVPTGARTFLAGALSALALVLLVGTFAHVRGSTQGTAPIGAVTHRPVATSAGSAGSVYSAQVPAWRVAGLPGGSVYAEQVPKAARSAR
jgi:hypothetical protein